MIPMLSGVRTEPGDMGLAEEGYMDEGIEEGPGEGEGPMEGEGRTWEGGADGGSINALDRGGLEPGPCCCNREVPHMHDSTGS